MRIAVIGFGGVGKAFVKLLMDKKTELKNEGMDITLNYVIGSKGQL